MLRFVWDRDKAAAKLRRLVVVAHAERGDEIRIINARPATRRERQTYEEDQ